MKILPTISVVIPTYNASKTIKECLESIEKQDYPKNKIEILVIDDDSTDGTLDILKRFSVKQYRNGKRNCEIGKSMGLQKAKNDLVMFLDADNILPKRDWIKKIVSPLIKDKDIAGSYAIWFKYDREDSPPNRYCSLFGINDPFQFYTKRQDRLMWAEKKWRYGGKSDDKGDYFEVTFKKNENIPTLGTIGFVCRRKLLLQTTYRPYFFHVDSCRQLVRKGHSKFAMVKTEIIHKHSDNSKMFLKKIKRNVELFFKYKRFRTYSWAVSDPRKIIVAAIKMASLILPFIDSLKGYIKLRDRAWFLHPFYCFSVVIIYGYVTIKQKIEREKWIRY